MILLPDKFWEIRNAKGKGRGVFALKNIPEGIIIGDYIGKIFHPWDAIIDEENFYLMYYHDRAVISPDLEKPGVHLLNHSCKPNTFLYIYKGHALAFSLRQISGGEELTVPYLLPPKDKFCDHCPHICRCGNLTCTGTMHLSKEKFDLWRKITDRQSKETKRERIMYGKELLLLSDYPKKIPEDYIEKIREFNI